MNKIEHVDKTDSFNWVKDYNEFLDKVKERKQTLNAQLSYSDLQIQDLLHYLEFNKCSAVTSAKITKKLKEIRIERRLVKAEYEELNSVDMLAKKSKYVNNKDYTFKTNIMDSIYKEKIIWDMYT